MKLAYIAAGAANMYCGSCIHDNTLARALQKKGVQTALIPTYTPLRTDERNVSMDRVFFGGINVFLQQKSALFRHTPRFIDRLFESPRLLRWVAKFSAATDARDLGGLTVSTLKGEQGLQRKELAKLIEWLRDDYKPDLVQLTNSMFTGFARMIKQELGVPVLCSLQGEDLFLESLIEPYKTQARELLRERSRDIDGFLANSEYYREFMNEYIGAPREKIHVVPLGLDLEGYDSPAAVDGPDPFVIGFLARVSPEKGFHVIAEAFHELAALVGKERIKLHVAGYEDEKDKAYIHKQKERLEAWGLADRVAYAGEVDRAGKLAFYRELNVFSTPAPYKEPKGLSALEAMASGVPVVQPDHGAFPAMIADTGGGVLTKPNDPKALALALKTLMDDPKRRLELGRKGRESVHARYSETVMAENTLAVYRQFAPQSPSPDGEKPAPVTAS